jgi:hypothetical protein
VQVRPLLRQRQREAAAAAPDVQQRLALAQQLCRAATGTLGDWDQPSNIQE